MEGSKSDVDWEKKAKQSLEQILSIIPEQLQNLSIRDLASQAEKQASKMGRSIVDMSSVIAALIANTPEHLRAVLKLTLMASGQWLETLESMLSGENPKPRAPTNDNEIPIDGDDDPPSKDRIDIDFD